MTQIRETVYNGRDNVISLVILENDEPVADLSGLNRVVVTVAGSAIDSDDVGSGVIWWTDSEDYEGTTVDVLRLRLGGQGIPEGIYTDVCLILFEPATPNGVLYANNIRLTVVAGCSVGG